MMILNEDLVDHLDRNTQPLSKVADLDGLIDLIKDKEIVMLGEATHGTSEFYDRRAEISKILIKDHGFQFIAVEGDYPDSQRINQYIKGKGPHSTALQVLIENHRWPTWMWANQETALFIEWLKHENSCFFGLDVYSLFESIENVVTYVYEHHPNEFSKALHLARCFEPFERDEMAYAKSLYHFPEGCADEIIEILDSLLSQRLNQGSEHLDALQNAKIIKNAERYYRSLIFQDEESWNIRDQHMMDTLSGLNKRLGPGIVWAHNTHIGDYRATPMKDYGLVNLGGLAREQMGHDKVALVGFGTYEGEVVASTAWGRKEMIMPIPPAIDGSYEKIFHDYCEMKNCNEFYLNLTGPEKSVMDFQAGHRAIGVVYSLPESRSQFVPTKLASRYDAFVFIDETSALNSLHADVEEEHLFPETFPSGQ